MTVLDGEPNDIFSNPELLKIVRMGLKPYSDEPIIKRASRMSNYTPKKITEMRHISDSYEHYSWTSARLFLKQGKFMADYEDDFEYDGTFFRYYPTYQLMSDPQLRGYFSWRTKVRRGDIRPTSLSFVFVYLYELINLIGVDSPLDGYHKILDFCEKYSKLDNAVNGYMHDWIIDYVVYYGLDADLIRKSENAEQFRRHAVLCEYGKHTKDELLDAIYGLSSYNITNSKFYKAYPEDTDETVYKVFNALSEHYSKSCKNSLCERFFGKPHTTPYTLFSTAVFCDTGSHESTYIELFPGYEYFCRSGRWYRTRLDRVPSKNRKLGAMLRDIDAIMREKYSFGSPLQKTDKTKLFTRTVECALDKLAEEKKQEAARTVTIDLSKLSGIRTDAKQTRDKLLTEAETEPDEATQTIEVYAKENAVAEDEGTEYAPTLDETERLVLKSVLYETDCMDELRRRGKMLSVVAESVNDKLFDIFGDNVIYFDGDTPAVFEDYKEELKGML